MSYSPIFALLLTRLRGISWHRLGPKNRPIRSTIASLERSFEILSIHAGGNSHRSFFAAKAGAGKSPSHAERRLPETPPFRPLFEFFRAERWDKTRKRACTIAALDRTEKNAPIPQKEFAKSDKPIVRSGVSIPEQCPTETLRILVCGCAPSARTLVSYPSLAPQGSLSTNAKKVTVSVLYWYEKLSILQRMKFLKRF